MLWRAGSAITKTEPLRTIGSHRIIHPSIRTPNNPNEQAAFRIWDKSFRSGDIGQ